MARKYNEMCTDGMFPVDLGRPDGTFFLMSHTFTIIITSVGIRREHLLLW